MSRHARYPRFFARLSPDNRVETIAKAETPEDAAQYTVDNGWREKGVTGEQVNGGAVDGHTMGLSVEGDEGVLPKKQYEILKRFNDTPRSLDKCTPFELAAYQILRMKKLVWIDAKRNHIRLTSGGMRIIITQNRGE